MLRGEVSATDYLFTWYDRKGTDEDLNAEGNAFMLHYYERGPYFQNLEMNFGPMYVRPEREHDFGKFSEMV
jgi:hypothetical protein